jgi:phosphatidylserine/phosphatidylglycerophosphate/cardiolipin synthase-like enzyme
LSASSLAFNSVNVGQTSAAQTVTLSNIGGLAVSISAITLSDTTDYTLSDPCGSSLPASFNCSLTITFKPQSVATSLPATVTITSNATESPETISLSGAGTSGGGSTVSYHMYVLPDPGTGSGSAFLPAMQALIQNAQKSIDMTMYELEDSSFTGWLTAACARGVTVRVIMDQGELSSSGNKSTFNTLNSSGSHCSAAASNPAFTNTHQKTMTVDGTTTVIMSLNLQSQYYSTTRDFAMVENDPADVAAIEATFNQDYAAGNSGPSDFSYQPGSGDDLIWSPTTAKADMLSIIQNAKSTLLIENEELASSASYIISALTTACQSGVKVNLAMVDESDYEPNFTTLTNAGCGVHTVADTTTGFYIHAKAVVADYGLSTQQVYMGSINYSNASMTQNRELGMYVTDQPSIDLIESVMSSDYANATPWPTVP